MSAAHVIAIGAVLAIAIAGPQLLPGKSSHEDVNHQVAARMDNG
jgi:hypothetical protein